MEKIFATIDAQGFVNNGKFIIRELAFDSADWCMCTEVDNDLIFHELSYQDQESIRFNTKYVHALRLRPKTYTFIKQEDVASMLRQVYHRLHTEEKPYFGVKNNQFAEILKELNIPHIQLDDVPSWRMLDDYYKTKHLCEFHERETEGICAMRKVTNMWKWIQETIRVDEFMNWINDDLKFID